MQDLLSFLHPKTRGKREDLATEVLALLLREDPGQYFLRHLLSEHAVAAPLFVEIDTQKTVAGCRPDIHLSYENRSVAVLEMKFWASLTPCQVDGSYFKAARLVIFVAPTERISELEVQLTGQNDPLGGNKIGFLSWEDLLNGLQKACHKKTEESFGYPGQTLFESALAHLKEFCNVSEKEHFTPFTPEQLQEPADHASPDHLAWLVNEVLSTANTFQWVSPRKEWTASFDSALYYGKVVTIEDIPIWFGYWGKAWKESPEDGPLWLQIMGEGKKLLSASVSLDIRTVGGSELASPVFRPGTSPANTQDDEVALILAAIKLFTERLKMRLQTFKAASLSDQSHQLDIS